MILWCSGMAVVLVHMVFQSSGIDYRLIAVGSLIPLAVDAVSGERSYGSTLLLTLVLLAAVMVLTIGRPRLLRRRLLCVPIGSFFGLVLSGAWLNGDRFWWPFMGGSISTDPLVGSWLVVVLLELAGLGAWWWIVQRFDLADPQRRSTFLHDGRLA